MSTAKKAPSNRLLKIGLPFAVIALGVLCAFVLVKTKPEVETTIPEKPPLLVRVFEAAPRSVSLDVSSQGSVEPRTDTTLSAEVGGRIESVSSVFLDGGVFRAGEVLLELDPRDYRVAVASAEAALAQAEVRLEQERAEAEVAKREWESLSESGESASSLVLREPQVREAQARVEAAKASLEKAKLDLERTTVRAPFAGRIRKKLADLGQTVLPGTPLASAYAIDYVEVRLPVPVSELDYLDLSLTREMRRGPEVALSADFGGSKRTWTGRIVRTAGEIDPQTRMLPLIARVQDPLGQAAQEAGAPLNVGLFVRAEIAGRNAEGVYPVPRGALRDVGEALDPDRGRILVVEEGALQFRDVEILRVMGDTVLLSEGLRRGDLVCISPLDTPVDGLKVRTQMAEPFPNSTHNTREVQS